MAVAGNLPLRELTELADKVVKVQLERSYGVGEVRLVGGLNRAINVWVEADRLAAYQLPITAVRDALVRQNADMPGGNVTAGLRESSLRTLGRVADPRAFEDVVIATVNGAPIRVRDVGRAEDGTAEQRSVARLNGVPSVILEVRRQSGENTVAVIEAAKQSLARLARPDARRRAPRGHPRPVALHLRGAARDQACTSCWARSSRRWSCSPSCGAGSPPSSPPSPFPRSVVSAFGMMWALGFTLNSVTMLALVLMVGIVIDDAIVVLENVFRFIEEKRMNAFEAARAATADIGLAVMATTFSLVVIFLPVSFMSSVSGRFLYQFGVTAAVSVLVSLLVSFTLTPMMSARMIRAGRRRRGHGHGHEEAASRRGFYAWLDRGYTWTLRLSMRYRWAVIGDLPRRHRVHVADLRLGEAGVHADRRRRERVRGDHQRPGGHLDARDGRGGPGHRRPRWPRCPGVQTVLITAGGSFLGRISQGNIYVRTAPHEGRTFGLGRLWRETHPRRSAWRRSAATTPSAT